jgi:hypothetical protein
VAAHAARLAAANATAARGSIKAAASNNSTVKAGLRSCGRACIHGLRVGAGVSGGAGFVTTGRYAGVRKVVNAAKYLDGGCSGMARTAAMPRENTGVAIVSRCNN